MADPYSGATNPSSSTSNTNWLSDISSGIGLGGFAAEIGAGAKPTATQDIQAGTSAAKLGTSLGTQYFGLDAGTASSVGKGAAGIANLAAVYSGIKQGGAQGYGSAAVNATAFAAREGAFGGYSGAVEGVASDIAAAYAVYQFAKNWQSGATGSEAIQGAEAGAAVGTAIEPGIGTVVGLVAGAAVGAISSAFGPGRKDPEQYTWGNYFAEYKQPGGAQALQNITPAQSFQTLAGIFDARSSDTPIYAQFGRFGEGAFTTAMADQINSAIASGKISTNASAQDIFNQVVNPWIGRMNNPASSTGKGWAGKGYQGDVPAIQNLITSMIHQYTTGQLTSNTSVGIKGQKIGNLPAYGSQGAPSPQTQQALQAGAQTTQGWVGSVNQLAYILNAARGTAIARHK